MSDSKPAKAKLVEQNKTPGGGRVAVVQFNPETLKVTYANQIVQPKSNFNGKVEGSEWISRSFICWIGQTMFPP